MIWYFISSGAQSPKSDVERLKWSESGRELKIYELYIRTC